MNGEKEAGGDRENPRHQGGAKTEELSGGGPFGQERESHSLSEAGRQGGEAGRGRGRPKDERIPT